MTLFVPYINMFGMVWPFHLLFLGGEGGMCAFGSFT